MAVASFRVPVTHTVKLCGPSQVIGVVVPIDFLQHFGGHAEESGCLPNRHAVLHQPSRGGVAQGVGGNPPGQTGEPHGAVPSSRVALMPVLDRSARQVTVEE